MNEWTNLGEIILLFVFVTRIGIAKAKKKKVPIFPDSKANWSKQARKSL